ncbi:hypothetical protein GCM10010495_18830 [Kitasatospora herbaricolor]|nr:hypothetical protein [Kitasatospora herbaricolor]MDQ0308329.1 hypothetical protein [Kitasatospora herbaricolor]GGV06753.1 hypothetical protein GCM10010495_18830 [Kitasatospora herbaricolor]
MRLADIAPEPDGSAGLLVAVIVVTAAVLVGVVLLVRIARSRRRD